MTVAAAALASHSFRRHHHGHRRKRRRHNLYGMVPGPFGMQLLNQKKDGTARERPRSEDSGPEEETELKAQMAIKVWTVEGLLMVILFLLFCIVAGMMQPQEIPQHYPYH